MIFADRADAGRKLASMLGHFQNKTDTVILALPRGGIPVAHEIAKALHLPLDVFVVRKLGVPDQEELAMGAISTGHVRIINQEVVRDLGIPQEVIDAVTGREHEELVRRERLYRGNRPAQTIRGQTVILVDDGIATGSTMRAAITAIRQHNPARIVVAVPIAAPDIFQRIAAEVDEMICAAEPEPLRAISCFYQKFPQTSDAEVRDLLDGSLGN